MQTLTHAHRRNGDGVLEANASDITLRNKTKIIQTCCHSERGLTVLATEYLGSAQPLLLYSNAA